MSMRRILAMVPVFLLVFSVAAPAFAGGSSGGKGRKATTNVRVANLTPVPLAVAATNGRTPAESRFKEITDVPAQFKVNRGKYFLTYTADGETIGQTPFQTGSAATQYIVLEEGPGGIVASLTDTKF